MTRSLCPPLVVVVAVVCAVLTIETARGLEKDTDLYDEYLQYDLTGHCAKGNHTILDDDTRDVTYGEGLACDYAMKYGWYRLRINATDAIVPTSCVQFGHCGTYDPVWIDLQGADPPKPGEQRMVKACANNLPDCCARHWNFTMLNCGPFFLYQLAATPGCYFRYCALRV